MFYAADNEPGKYKKGSVEKRRDNKQRENQSNNLNEKVVFCPREDARICLGIFSCSCPVGENKTHLGWEADMRGGRGWDGWREGGGGIKGRVGHRNKPSSHLMSSLSIIPNSSIAPSLLLDTETQYVLVFSLFAPLPPPILLLAWKNLSQIATDNQVAVCFVTLSSIPVK